MLRLMIEAPVDKNYQFIISFYGLSVVVITILKMRLPMSTNSSQQIMMCVDASQLRVSIGAYMLGKRSRRMEKSNHETKKIVMPIFIFIWKQRKRDGKQCSGRQRKTATANYSIEIDFVLLCFVFLSFFLNCLPAK